MECGEIAAVAVSSDCQHCPQFEAALIIRQIVLTAAPSLADREIHHRTRLSVVPQKLMAMIVSDEYPSLLTHLKYFKEGFGIPKLNYSR